MAPAFPDWEFRQLVEVVVDPDITAGLFVLELNGKVYHCDQSGQNLVGDLRAISRTVNHFYNVFVLRFAQ
mgnify:CR=1 FL=1